MIMTINHDNSDNHEIDNHNYNNSTNDDTICVMTLLCMIMYDYADFIIYGYQYYYDCIYYYDSDIMVILIMLSITVYSDYEFV